MVSNRIYDTRTEDDLLHPTPGRHTQHASMNKSKKQILHPPHPRRYFDLLRGEA